MVSFYFAAIVFIYVLHKGLSGGESELLYAYAEIGEVCMKPKNDLTDGK